MANPAPIISQINAFNATEGTIISFNIVGGTSIVRSNIIYIYDLSDNSLICTHLYISTESIHELPANTDPSIAYASGKSSADFTNGKQYYAQIQTFTNTAGTEGASGASIAKLFWCLVDPTLTINTIPSSISTTSYNVGAVYNSNTTATSNIVQQYQFNLYSATGVLVQSSGVITGSGAQQGTSTAYDLSYNFTGLNVGSSYYVTAEVTTTQGMTVSAQSSTFTVSIDTPTLGEATVVNNACDGYISVTSNLSSEYGGSASGEIASFVTNSVNNISSLTVNLDPIQDLNGYDSPWVGGAGKNVFDLNPYDGMASEGLTYTLQENGKLRVNGTCTGDGWNYQTTNITFPYHGINAGDNIYLYTNTRLFMRFYDANNTLVGDSQDHSATIPTTAVRAVVYIYPKAVVCNVGEVFDTELEFCISKVQLSSFEPYTNICPISGRTEVETIVSPTTDADDGETYTTALGQTVYSGTLDLVSGRLVVDRKAVFYDGSSDEIWGVETQAGDKSFYTARQSDAKPLTEINLSNMLYSTFQFRIENWAVGECRLTNGYYNFVVGSIVGATTVDQWRAWLNNNPISYTYELATPLTYQLTPKQIQTLVGTNNVWSEQGDIELSYHIPITNLLVKRQDVDDVSGNWLTLYSQPITQASDMDFTFIDFLNQYGKTYKYALVPLLTQEQSGVEVEVEGGYTVSDEVVSIFDGVFVADNTAIYKLKAGVNYGDLSKVQEVGSINTIGSQYPIIVSNSKVDYRTASLSATIVADDYYDNGNLNRMDMVQKRELMESFFTNKRAKILKDWNGNIWLVVFIDNINISFINEYGMGIATLTATWTEIGDVTSEEDLQNTRIINVG